MMRPSIASAIAAAVLMTAGTPMAYAQNQPPTLAITMTNDPIDNQIKVYDVDSHALLQTLSTHGKGGAGGNARGIRQSRGELVAVVNNGSNTVALFRRGGNGLNFSALVTTSSAPVSVDFGNDHMYVAGATTVDSFLLHNNTVDSLDGTALLQLAGGGIPPDGSTAQVGVLNATRLLVTLKTDPDPGTVDIVTLEQGRIGVTTPTAISAPAGSLTPFGFTTYPDGTALITLAHSNQDGLFRDGAFTAVIAAGQDASCWMTRVGKYVFVANTGSHTISRLIGTGINVFVDQAVAAPIQGGSPADLDAEGSVLGVIDHGAGQSHLSLFAYNEFGELTAIGSPITVGVPNANGVAILKGNTP